MSIARLPLLLLAGGIVGTFETVTMAGSTWFRSVQFDVQLAQAELGAMQQRRDGLYINISFDAQQAVVASLQAQFDSLPGPALAEHPNVKSN